MNVARLVCLFTSPAASCPASECCGEDRASKQRGYNRSTCPHISFELRPAQVPPHRGKLFFLCISVTLNITTSTPYSSHTPGLEGI
ncbi:hypothetical protein F5B20DRAFT_367839 [Whalleya microplaca]|nr:hypothetical protein F5B20DRAFT_367839 [Whalleya microplaca]